MNDTPRKVKFSTKLNILKKRPLLVLFGSLFTFMGLLFLIMISIIFLFSEGEETPQIGIVPIIILIIGLLMLSYVIADLKKELKLYKLGTVARGKIVSLMPKSGLFTLLNFGQGIIVHYEYQLKNGDKIIRKSFTNDLSIVTDKKKDDFIPIFVSPKDEQKSCVVSKLQSLRNNWNIDFA